MTTRRKLTAAEEAAIQTRIAADPDAPEATDEHLAQAKPFGEHFPALAESIRRGRGRPRVAAPKEVVSLRLDQATLARFKATGDGWRLAMAAVVEEASTGLIERLKRDRGSSSARGTRHRK